MSKEPFNPEKFKGVSVSTVFSHLAEGNRPFTAQMQNRFLAIENIQLSPEGEPNFMLQLAEKAISGGSLRNFASEYGFTRKTIKDFMDAAGIPLLSPSEIQRQRMADPERRKNLAEKANEQWKDSSLREAQSKRAKLQWQDPEFLAFHSEKMKAQREDPRFIKLQKSTSAQAMTILWQEPTFRAAAVERSRQSMIRLHQNPDLIEKGAEASKQTRKLPEYSAKRRDIALALWQKDDYRSQLSAIHTELWRDPEYRQMIMKALRTARLDPANRDRYYLPTIQGFRPDIGFHAQSIWEANVARVFRLTARDFEIGINLPLIVEDQFRDIFGGPETVFSVDFATTDRRGNPALYEIMAHPLEDPDGWAKLVMAQDQYPNLNIKAIDPQYYKTLQRRFEGRVNLDPNLLGWEKDGFNLKTNPEIFNPEPNS